MRKSASPKPVHCKAILGLLLHLCGEDRSIFNWVLKWLAYPIQHPGAKMMTALEFRGPQGAGKTLFWRIAMEMHAPAARIVDASHIHADKFNGWAAGCRLLLVEEAINNQSTRRVIHRLLTEREIAIHRKGIAECVERNEINLVLLNNSLGPFDPENRRLISIVTGPAVSSRAYTGVVRQQKRNGAAALRRYLQVLDLGGFDQFTLPPKFRAIPFQMAMKVAG